MIRTASEEDVPQLKQLFKTCFNDSDDFLNLFFKEYFPATTGMVAICEKQIAAMLFLCPATMTVNTTCETLYYVYACATLPDFRRKGLMENLLDAAFEYAREQKAWGLLLVPANEPLFDYYEKLGFIPFSSLKEIVVAPAISIQPIFSLCELTPEEVTRIRTQKLNHDYQIHWNAAHVAFTTDMLKQAGGGLIGLRQENGRHDYLLYEVDEELLTVVETSVEEQLLPQLAAFLQQQFAVSTVHFYLQTVDYEQYSLVKSVKPFSIPKNVIPYFNLDMG